jgi:hypothetical protein
VIFEVVFQLAAGVQVTGKVYHRRIGHLSRRNPDGGIQHRWRRCGSWLHAAAAGRSSIPPAQPAGTGKR